MATASAGRPIGEECVTVVRNGRRTKMMEEARMMLVLASKSEAVMFFRLEGDLMKLQNCKENWV